MLTPVFHKITRKQYLVIFIGAGIASGGEGHAEGPPCLMTQ